MKLAFLKGAWADRPRPILTYTRLMVICDAIAVLTFVVTVFLVVRAWSELPARIPANFDMRGEVRGWGGKGSLIFGPTLSILTGILVGIVSRYPHTFNYPFPITQENAQRQYTLARELMSMMRMQTTFIGLLIAWMQIGAARDGIAKNSATALVLVTAMVAPMMLLVIYLARANSGRS